MVWRANAKNTKKEEEEEKNDDVSKTYGNRLSVGSFTCEKNLLMHDTNQMAYTQQQQQQCSVIPCTGRQAPKDTKSMLALLLSTAQRKRLPKEKNYGHSQWKLTHSFPFNSMPKTKWHIVRVHTEPKGILRPRILSVSLFP